MTLRGSAFVAFSLKSRHGLRLLSTASSGAATSGQFQWEKSKRSTFWWVAARLSACEYRRVPELELTGTKVRPDGMKVGNGLHLLKR